MGITTERDTRNRTRSNEGGTCGVQGLSGSSSASTSSSRDGGSGDMDMGDRARDAANRARETAREATDRARQTASDVADRARETARDVGETVRHKASDLRDTMEDRMRAWGHKLEDEETSRKLGTGVGAVTGAAVGAVIGGFVGRMAGKKASHAIEDRLDARREHEYWSNTYRSRPYTNENRSYEQYAPAYQFGWESCATCVSNGGSARFERYEGELARDWESGRGDDDLSWQEARPAVRDAWNRTSSLYTY